ncbi:MAG: hypothetical protein O2955_20325 [Planctomycetota bacterium]|nr:hypothetical protein [Planctomycetota bacterium]MDA1214855.1 hypothetical protein [Planctomycetota bacterium]
MAHRHASRRDFLRTTAGSLATFSGGLAFLSHLPRVSSQEAKVNPEMVRYSDNIEPLVRLIENTPRESLLENLAAQIHAGRSYGEVLAALLLAGVRNVQPRPSVGFKFHCVLVVNSCHLASLAGPDEDRWLPLFWALDYFKSSQADEANSTGWKMKPVNESLVPDAAHARAMFTDAMETWDEDKADAATAGLVRTAGATDVFNLFANYAARDFRSIGHKAIYLANSWRTLQVIGWEYAEPVLRSLTFALLNHSGEANPAESDLAADRPWRENEAKLDRIPANWISGSFDSSATTQLFDAFRNAGPSDAAETAADAMSRGVGAQSIWNGVFVGAGELLMRQPGIIGLHGLTTANAMHYLWVNANDDRLRRRLLLQACSFNPMFRESAQGRGRLGDQQITALEPAKLQSSGVENVSEILADISSDRLQAAQKVFGYLSSGGNADELIAGARRMLFVKGDNAHDYKFSEAVLEDYKHVSPEFRDRFMAAAVYNLRGSGDRDNGLVQRTRAALVAAR